MNWILAMKDLFGFGNFKELYEIIRIIMIIFAKVSNKCCKSDQDILHQAVQPAMQQAVQPAVQKLWANPDSIHILWSHALEFTFSQLYTIINILSIFNTSTFLVYYIFSMNIRVCSLSFYYPIMFLSTSQIFLHLFRY